MLCWIALPSVHNSRTFVLLYISECSAGLLSQQGIASGQQFYQIFLNALLDCSASRALHQKNSLTIGHQFCYIFLNTLLCYSTSRHYNMTLFLLYICECPAWLLYQHGITTGHYFFMLKSLFNANFTHINTKYFFKFY